MSYDSWGKSWGTAWGVSWVHQARLRTIDTHDGFDREFDLKKRKEELHEQIVRAFEDITGENELPTVQRIVQAQKSRPMEYKALSRIKNDRVELEEINQHLVLLSKQLQEQEIQDIVFIVSLL